MTYITETRASALKTKCLLKTSETRISRRIAGKTLLAEVRRENMRSCKVEDINEWNEHINRVENSRPMKNARKLPIGKRNISRSRKR